MVRHSNQLYNHIWCLIFILVPIKLIKIWIYFNFNVKTLFFLKIHTPWIKGSLIHWSLWLFFLKNCSNATRKTRTFFGPNLFRVTPLFLLGHNWPAFQFEGQWQSKRDRLVGRSLTNYLYDEGTIMVPKLNCLSNIYNASIFCIGKYHCDNVNCHGVYKYIWWLCSKCI